MAETAEEKMFTVYEWTIENFSSWRKDVHGTELLTEPRPNMVQFDLFRARRGGPGFTLGGGKEKLWVNLHNVPGTVKGDFSLIYPDGSIIWKTPAYREDGDFDNVFIGGLPFNFRDLVALIRKNESVHGDRLTLRFRFENGERNILHSRHSMLEVRTMSIKISLASILNSQPERNDHARVITVEYPLNDGSTEKVKVRINEKPSSKLELILDPSFSKENIFFQTRMSVLRNDGSVIRIEEFEDGMLPDQTFVFSDSLTRNEVVLEGLSILLQLTVFPSDKLKHLYTLSSPFVTEVTTNSASTNKPEEHAVAVLMKDFLSLHQNREFSDLQLHCEGVSFPVHKSILSARSPVFKTMLSSDMKEAASGSVDIADLDASTLARFLTFLYSGTVNDLQSEGAIKLYYAADKYQVPTLKTACVSFLSADLSTETVCDVLSLADQHRDGSLLSAAHSFILKNYNKVLGSEEWESLMKRDSFLASKTLTDFARGRYVISKEASKN